MFPVCVPLIKNKNMNLKIRKKVSRVDDPINCNAMVSEDSFFRVNTLLRSVFSQVYFNTIQTYQVSCKNG